MFAESEEGLRIVASLARRTNGSTDIEWVADAIVSMFRDMDIALVPIIGMRGVAALHRRSLFLCTSSHPQFAGTYDRLVVAMDLAEFKSVLVEQKQADAIFFGEVLLKTTYELLATLIGPSLSTRLLYEVWDNSLSAPTAQGTSS